ncbi:uncharacterized protein BDZ99DRAFT_567736 [Mytilinidion resinicola]|uniref:F-box domain-containing protein n=1 Tax=Mytilinidion resinicola TaxID=574789 RepID=A0A6A6YYP4_9PEZI|nr:uncharacterized protein BDZ99DRAFT_567736 [Mytilinidion resinicola]KAF2814042.1 hypothetical protein BDZ99DRAFT_567736 [Mytilinidion resinicola]
MSSLLSIPREIRDNIIELSLSCVRKPHSSIAEAESTRSTKKNSHRPFFSSWSFGLKHVLFEPPSYTSSSLALLLVNHQLSSETVATLSRLSNNAQLPPYELDVMFVRELELWPTWLSVPVIAKHLDRVNVTFRALGLHTGAKRQWNPGDGSPPQILWCFYYLMEHVLRQGPLPHTSSSADRGVSIKTLHLDFVGPDGETCATDTRYYIPSTVAWKGKEVRPEFLAYYLWHNISMLAKMDYHTAEYGEILYERVGEVRFSVNGVEVQPPIDFGESLARLHYEGPANTFGHVWPREKRVPAFEEWKRGAWRKRVERGLPVVGGEGGEAGSRELEYEDASGH